MDFRLFALSEDDAAYRRNVRNMALVLAAITITIFAAIFIPPVINPVHEQFAPSGSATSPYGFTINVKLNSTSLRDGGGVAIEAWLNSTSPQLDNVTAESAWPVGPEDLWTKVCVAGWPLGIGVMSGYYTQDNYTSGSLLQIPQPIVSCPEEGRGPAYFILQPFSDNALVEASGTAQIERLQSSLTFSGADAVGHAGAFTVLAADEWGDMVLVHLSYAP